MSARDAAKAIERLQHLQRARAPKDMHAIQAAQLDVDYLYRLVLERASLVGKAITADDHPEAAIDKAYVDRVWAAAADAANALAYLAARITPKAGRILPSAESRGAIPLERKKP